MAALEDKIKGIAGVFPATRRTGPLTSGKPPAGVFLGTNG
jgi:hypothetical protein